MAMVTVGFVLILMLQLLYGALAFVFGVILLHSAPVEER
jgi:hypothetical protein